MKFQIPRYKGGGSDVVSVACFWCQNFGDVLFYVCSLYV